MAQLNIDPQHVIDVLKKKLSTALEENVVLTAAVNQLQEELEKANDHINQRDSEIATYKQKEATGQSLTSQEPMAPSSGA